MNKKDIHNLKEFSLDLLFPKFCQGCQKEGSYLCEDCRQLLEILEYNYCICDKNPIITLKGTCKNCQDKELSGLYFALPYKKALTKKLLYNFKYKPFIKDLAKTLASILVEHFVLTKNNTNSIWENSALVPVPLDKNKLKARGYNQSEELAKELSKILNVPVLADYLIKIKSTQPQAKLKKQEREKNLQGAFAISVRHCEESRQRGMTKQSLSLPFKKVFLVDDVYTTGSTMQECAKVLKKSGIKQVWGITLAREEWT